MENALNGFDDDDSTCIPLEEDFFDSSWVEQIDKYVGW